MEVDRRESLPPGIAAYIIRTLPPVYRVKNVQESDTMLHEVQTMNTQC